MSKLPFIIYVDVDDTFVRSHGTKRIPIPIVIEHIKSLKAQGANLYCWSSGGSEYAKYDSEYTNNEMTTCKTSKTWNKYKN